MDEIKEDTNCITKAFDVGKILDIVNIRASIQNYEEDERMSKKITTKGGQQNVLFLTSDGVYILLWNRKRELAKKFRKWAKSILDDIIFNDSNELRKQLEIKDKEIEKLKIKHGNDLDNKDKEKHWLHLLTKNQISYKKFITKKDGIYQGSSEFENHNYIEKNW